MALEIEQDQDQAQPKRRIPTPDEVFGTKKRIPTPDEVFGVKKKVGGEISSLTELPSEFTSVLKKGVDPNKNIPAPTKEEERVVKSLGIKPMTGVIVPTNLPVSEQKKYESELVKKDAVVNTLMNTYKVKGLKFDPESPIGKKQIDSYLDNLRNNDLVLVEGKDKKPYLTRSQSTLETFGKSIFNSIKAPIEAVKVNTMNDPQDFADYMNEKIKNEPNIPESAPSGASGYVSELAGGLPKLAALFSIPYFGEAAMVTEMYHTSLANQREQLYRKGIQQGLNDIDAATQAMQSAPITAIPDAAMGVVLGRGFSGGSIVPEAPKKVLVDALMKYAKGTARVSGAGGLSENARAGLEELEGYKLEEGERAERTLTGASDWAIMHTAFDRGGWMLKNAPKFVSSAYKNFLTNIPKPILEAEAAKYPNGKEILDQVESFAETKRDIQDLVPEEKVGSVTGLTQKIETIQSDIYELETRKVKAPDALKPQIDKWIKEYKDEIQFYNKQIDKVTKSSDPTGLSEEIDNLTGKKAGTKTYTVDGKEISQEEFDALQDKPIGTKEIITAEIKVKPTEDISKANVTIEGTTDGYKVISGDKANSIGDIRQEANEARKKGQDTFTKETIKDGKKIFTLTDTTVSDAFGRPGFKSASVSFPEGTKITMEDVMPKLKSELGVKEEGSLVKEKITIEEPTEINGLKVVKKIDEDIYQVEPQKLPASGGGEAFFTKYYTSDGREVLVSEEMLKKAEEVKPTEVKIEDVTSKQKDEKFDAPTLKSPASNYEKLYVPKKVLEEAYKNDKDNNPVLGGGGQSLETIIRRGGYSIEELNKLLPNWKEIASSKEVKPIEVVEKEVKPTEEIKEEIKAEPIVEEVNKPEVISQVEPLIEEQKPKIDIENKEYITKKGNIVNFEEGKLITKDKEGNVLSDRASKKSIEEYADNYDFSIGEKAEVPEEITDSRQQTRYAVENTKSPLEIAQIYSSETPMPFELDAKMQAIAENGLGRIKTSSYERFGDPNLIEKSMYLNIFSEKRGQTIDQLAEEISGKGLLVEPKDIVDYIEKYSRGDKKALELQETDVQLMAKDKFKQLTGLDLDSELSNKIIDKELQKAKKEQLDILKQDYETAKQLEDAYWQAYNETDGFTKESPVSKANEPKIEKESITSIVEPSLKMEEETKPLKLNDKAILNRLYESKNTSDFVKRKFEENGLKYQTASQEEAKKIASEIVKEYGNEDATALAEAGKFDGDVNSFIFSKSINDIAELEINAKTPEEKTLYAQKWADYALRFDEAARKGGRFISAISDFYKKSPLGVKIYEETRRKEVFKEWFKNKESDIKDVYKQILEQPEFKDLIKEEAQKEIKKERAEIRKEKRQKIDDFFENAKLKGNNLYAVPIPLEVINGALEIMKQTTLAGESVTFAVQQAINHISKEIKEWDSEKFRNEYQTKLNALISDKKEKTYDNLLKERINNLEKQIKSYEEKIEQGGADAKKRVGKFDNAEEVKKLVEERDRLRDLYEEARKSSKEYIDKKSKQYLDRFGKKLKSLTDGQKEKVVRESIMKLIDNGALEFDEFKDIISNTLGLGKIGNEEFQKLKEYTVKINRVGELREGVVKEENRTQQNLDEYYKAQKEASIAVKDLNKIIYTKPDITNRLLGIMQLNTLGIASLAANVTYNVFNQSLIRFPRALVETGLENFVFGTTYALNKINGANIIYPDNIPFAGQKEFFTKLGEGIKIATKQILTGERKYDYLQKEIFTSQIHPFTSGKEIWQFKKGDLNLSKEQVVDKAIQATVGIPAEVVARLLNLGDTPERYAAEGAVASSFAKKYGLTDMNYKYFLEFPKEIVYQEERKLGKSAEEASKKAEYVEKRIINAGAESVMQQENLLNDMINAAVTGAAKYGKATENAVKIVKVLNMPYLKIPLNSAWSFYNLANPEIAFAQSMIYGAKYLKTKDAIDIQNSKKWLAHGMVGMAFLGIAGYLSSNGIINSSNDGKDTKKEREGERFYERQGMINISKLNALLKGENPNNVKESYNMDLKYFGTTGDILDMQAKKLENMTPEQKENGIDFMENIASNFHESTSRALETGAFSNTVTILNAINQNNTSFLNSYFTSLINMGANIVQPATFAQMSRSQLPYYTQAKADNYFDEIKNNFLTRSSTLRVLTGKYPPSKIGIWGDTLENKEDYTLKIFGISKSNKDNFAQPIYDDYKRTNNLKFFPPSVMPEVNEIKLNVQQQQELEQLVGNQRRFMVTPFVNDGAILKTFKKVYSKLDDDDKVDALRVIYEEGYKKAEEQFIINHKEFYKPTKKTKEEKQEAKEVRGFRKSIKKMFK